MNFQTTHEINHIPFGRFCMRGNNIDVWFLLLIGRLIFSKNSFSICYGIEDKQKTTKKHTINTSTECVGRMFPCTLFVMFVWPRHLTASDCGQSWLCNSCTLHSQRKCIFGFFCGHFIKRIFNFKKTKAFIN